MIQAETYITGLFATFESMVPHGTPTKPVLAEFGVEGFFFRYGRYFVYWRYLSNGDIGIVTILHERMHQLERFRDDFALKGKIGNPDLLHILLHKMQHNSLACAYCW